MEGRWLGAHDADGLGAYELSAPQDPDRYSTRTQRAVCLIQELEDAFALQIGLVPETAARARTTWSSRA